MKMKKSSIIVSSLLTSAAVVGTILSVSSKHINSVISLSNSKQAFDYTINDFDFINDAQLKAQAQDKKFDPRTWDTSYLTPVKNQGSQGLCWAYAAIAAAEINVNKSGLWKGNPKQLDFNEHNLDWNSKVRNSSNDVLGLNEGDVWSGNTGSGYNSYYASVALSQWLSVVDQNVANPESYHDPEFKAQNLIEIPIFRKQSGADKGAVDTINPIGREWIKEAILKYGAVTAAYEVADGPAGAKTYYTTESITDGHSGHVITIVGWDDNIPASNYSPQAKINGGWICKNSWGLRNQENGYFYMSYDSYISDLIAYQYMNGSATYDNNYYYDAPVGDGLVKDITGIKKGISIFPVKKAKANDLETIEGIQVGINGLNTKVKINIYDNINYDPMVNLENYEPVLPKPIYTQTNSFPMPGIYTVKLNQPIQVVQGNNFAVEVEIIDGEDGPSAEYNFKDILGLKVAGGHMATSQDDLTFYFDKTENKYKWMNAFQNSNNVMRIRALTNSIYRAPIITNDIRDANLVLDKQIINLDDISSYPKFQSFRLHGQDLDISQFDIKYKKVLWDVNVYNDFKNIGKVEVSITPKQDSGYIGEYKTYLQIKAGRAPYIKGLGEYQDIEINGWVQKPMGKINLFAGPSVKQYKDFNLPQGFKWSDPEAVVSSINNNISLWYDGPDEKYFRTKNWDPQNITITKTPSDAKLLPAANFIQFENIPEPDQESTVPIIPTPPEPQPQPNIPPQPIQPEIEQVLPIPQPDHVGEPTDSTLKYAMIGIGAGMGAIIAITVPVVIFKKLKRK